MEREEKTVDANEMRGAWVRVSVFFLVVVVLGAGLASTLQQRIGSGGDRVRYRVLYDHVEGLDAGAPVRLAGVDVGVVEAVEFVALEGGRDRIGVTLAVEAKRAPLVRKDVKAYINSEGLLGDRYVELSLGEPSAGTLPAGSEIEGVTPVMLARTMQKLDESVENFRKVSGAVKWSVEKTEAVGGLWGKFMDYVRDRKSGEE